LIRLDAKDSISDVAAVIADEDDEVEENGKRPASPEEGPDSQQSLFEEKKTPEQRAGRRGKTGVKTAKAPEPRPLATHPKTAPEKKTPKPQPVRTKRTPAAKKAGAGKKPPRRGK
jgi:hypothetical protein